jgi:cell division protein FtsQ
MEDAQRLPLSKMVVTGERHYTRNDDIRQFWRWVRRAPL